MTQYNHIVEHHRELAEAEAWGKMADTIHSFNSDDTYMWYDRPQENGKRDGRVVDISYNSGLIERKISSTGKTIYIGKRVKGETLITRFRRRFQGKF
jgi:hypothetical protein